MKKKNGFISSSLIYSFFFMFLLLMIYLLNSYSTNRSLLETYKYDIKNNFASKDLGDINLVLMVYNSDTEEYEETEKLPGVGYLMESKYSYCKNGSSINYTNGFVRVESSSTDACYIYFKKVNQDIDVDIYSKETPTSNEILRNSIPSSNYDLSSYECDNGAEITFDATKREFTIKGDHATNCKAVFLKRENNVILHIYKENALGTHSYNEKTYSEEEIIPGNNYVFDSYTCVNTNVETVITSENNELMIDSPEYNECNVYYNGGKSNVDIIIMQETNAGVTGYTTGKLYSRTYGIPGWGYKYVGYKCNKDDAVVTFNNGVLEGTSTSDTLCYAYFEKYSSNVYIEYFLEMSNGEYERVGIVPNLGYVYNKDRSSCDNGSTITVKGNVPMIDASTEDSCHVYFDMALDDIKVNVYVMDRETNLYELGKVPVSGYEMYNAGCTNNADIIYRNGTLKVTSDGPTVCTVYFR